MKGPFEGRPQVQGPADEVMALTGGQFPLFLFEGQFWTTSWPIPWWFSCLCSNFGKKFVKCVANLTQLCLGGVLVTYGQNFGFKIRRESGKISYERRVYRSVGEKSIGFFLFLLLLINKISGMYQNLYQ